jgi:hypothetical protein
MDIGIQGRHFGRTGCAVEPLTFKIVPIGLYPADEIMHIY